MLKIIQRILATSISSILFITTLQSGPALADVVAPNFYGTTGLSVAYGEELEVPFVLENVTDEYLRVSLSGDGTFDITDSLTAHPNLSLYNGSTAVSDYIELYGPTEDIVDLLANLNVKHRETGDISAFDVRVQIEPLVDSTYFVTNPDSGNSYYAEFGVKNYNEANCFALYANPDITYDEINNPSSPNCYANGSPLIPRVHQGSQAHLATIESASENLVIVNNLIPNIGYWIDASDSNSDGVWKWTSGSSFGNQFWQGDTTGSPTNGAYTSWAAGNPVQSSSASDNTHAVITNTGWMSANSTDTYAVVLEFENPSGTNIGNAVWQSETVEVSVTYQTDVCLSYADEFDIFAIQGDQGQAGEFEINEEENPTNFDTDDFALNLTNLNNGMDANYDPIGDSYFSNNQTNQDDTCIKYGADGSLTIIQDATDGSDYGDGLTARYETKFLGDGATVRQTVSITNSTGSTVTPNDLEFNGYYRRSQSKRHVINSTDYGVEFAGPQKGKISVLWGGPTTTTTGNALPEIEPSEFVKYKDIDSVSSRFDNWQNLPASLLNGVAGTVKNWGANSVQASGLNPIENSNSYLTLTFDLADIPTGQTHSVVVFTEVQHIGVLHRPDWHYNFANPYFQVGQGFDVYRNLGLDHAEDLYTYEITNGELPTGLFLDSETGVLTGTTNDAIGSYIFEIAATPIDGFEELSIEYRTFNLEIISTTNDLSFETGNIHPWNTIDRQINLGVDFIAGCQTVDTQDYSYLEELSVEFESDNDGVINGERGGVEDNNVAETSYYLEEDEYTVTLNDEQETTDGVNSLFFLSEIDDTMYSYDIVHGPAAYSPVFEADAGQVYGFDWHATKDADAYAVFGYLLNVDTCQQTEILDSIGASSPWTKASVLIPSDGEYRFVFVHGTYDQSGGRAAGAELFIDNLALGIPIAPVWTDEVIADGAVGNEFYDVVSATGFPDPIISIIGGSLPDGLSMNLEGVITGIPSKPGQYTIKVKADNGVGIIYSTITFNITDENSADWTDRNIEPTMNTNSPYSDSVSSNISGSKTYSVSAGTLPDGLTLNPATGAITGTPTVAGDYLFEVQVTNGTDILTVMFTGFISEGDDFGVVPVTNGKYRWKAKRTTITWNDQDGAVSYVVKYKGITVCETTETSCSALGFLPKGDDVTITAISSSGSQADGPAIFVLGRVRAWATAHFDSSSYELSKADKADLKNLALALKAGKIKKVTLIGYTDSIGSTYFNGSLSLARAKAVKDYMSKFMSTKKFVVKARAATNPVKKNTSITGRAANRRVEVFFE